AALAGSLASRAVIGASTPRRSQLGPSTTPPPSNPVRSRRARTLRWRRRPSRSIASSVDGDPDGLCRLVAATPALNLRRPGAGGRVRGGLRGAAGLFLVRAPPGPAVDRAAGGAVLRDRAGVVVAPAVHDVRAARPDDRVAPCPAVELVVAGVAEDVVVPVIA